MNPEIKLEETDKILIKAFLEVVNLGPKKAKENFYKTILSKIREAYDAGVEEIREYCLDERDAVAKTPREFNKLEDAYEEGYYIAMNTVVEKIDELSKLKANK